MKAFSQQSTAITKEEETLMNTIKNSSAPSRTFTSSWSAFYLYYVAIAICWFGPHFNPAFAAIIYLTPLVGFILGLALLGGVLYLKLGQQYQIDPAGVKTCWLYPPREQLIRWQEIDSISVRAGLTQTLLGVGNVAIKPHQGDEMVWYGLQSPKVVKTLLERSLDESAAK
jgi:hypothetical protein